MLHLCQNLLTESDLERIDQAAMTVLEQQGAWLQSEKVLTALDAAGCDVDFQQEVARFPRQYLDEIIDFNRSLDRPEPDPTTGSEPYSVGVDGEAAQFVFDYEQFDKHPGTQEDFVELCKWAFALNDGQRAVGPMLLMRDVPSPIEPLESLALLYEHTGAPQEAYTLTADQLEYAGEMWGVLTGEPDDIGHHSTTCISVITPRRMDRRTGDYLAKRAERGYHYVFLTQAISGGTAPVTLAGAVVQAITDILTGWAVSHALNPQMELTGATLTGAMDMRTGNMSISCPESLLQDAAVCEVFRRLYGGGVVVACSAEYTDARVPGVHATYEKAIKAILISEYTGTSPNMGAGLIENGMTYSPEQLLLNQEMGEFLRHYYHGFEVNDETIALGDILEVGFGRQASFVGTDHTLRHFREVWYPKYFDRSLWEDGARELEKEQAIADKAHAEVQEIRRRYVPPEIDEDKLSALRAIVDKAASKLLE